VGNPTRSPSAYHAAPAAVTNIAPLVRKWLGDGDSLGTPISTQTPRRITPKIRSELWIKRFYLLNRHQHATRIAPSSAPLLDSARRSAAKMALNKRAGWSEPPDRQHHGANTTLRSLRWHPRSSPAHLWW
jgi:hypothetical protein